MFQLRTITLASIDRRHEAMYCVLGITSLLLRNKKRDYDWTVTSKFSYSSEIMEKNGSLKLKLAVTSW
ncbi:MAG: hypothetical protein QOH41_4171 [Blastocatellia bacterium]|jgi:hypothetical protein|nr:hypothetical protein [Blastocatellia bacterium]